MQLGHQHHTVCPARQDDLPRGVVEFAGDRDVVPVDESHDPERSEHRQDRDVGPGEELGRHDDHQDAGGDEEPDGVDRPGPVDPPTHGRDPLVVQAPGPVSDHAELAEREGDEHAHDVELDEERHLGVERHDQHDCRDREDDDPVGERQPVPAGGELSGQILVASEDRGQHREPVERRVGGECQDQRGDDDDGVEGERQPLEDRSRQLGDHRLLPVPLRSADQLCRRLLGDPDPEPTGQGDEPQEERDRENPEDGQRHGGVAGPRLPEGRDTVVDGFDPGQGGTSGCEGLGDDEGERESGQLRPVHRHHFESRGFGPEVAAQDLHLEQPPDDECGHGREERVDGDGEHRAGLTESTQVERRQEDDRQDGERDLPGLDERDRRSDGRGGGRNRHGHREDVVEQQGRADRQARTGAQIDGGDLVVASSRRVGTDVLPVTGDDDHQDRRHRQSHPRGERECRDPGDGEHEEDLLRGVGHRGQRVGREHRQRDPFAEAGGTDGVAARGTPHEETLGSHGDLRDPGHRHIVGPASPAGQHPWV